VPLISVLGKAVASAAIANPEASGKTLLVVLVALLFPLLVILAPFVLFLSVPLAAPPVTEMYVQGTQEVIDATVDSLWCDANTCPAPPGRDCPGCYPGPVSLDWRDVIVLDAVRRTQDFSHVGVDDVKDSAMRFLERTGTHFRKVKVGYRNVYDSEGRLVRTEPVYEMIPIPIYRVESLDGVMRILDFTQEQREWAHNMREGMR